MIEVIFERILFKYMKEFTTISSTITSAISKSNGRFKIEELLSKSENYEKKFGS